MHVSRFSNLERQTYMHTITLHYFPNLKECHYQHPSIQQHLNPNQMRKKYQKFGSEHSCSWYDVTLNSQLNISLKIYSENSLDNSTESFNGFFQHAVVFWWFTMLLLILRLLDLLLVYVLLKPQREQNNLLKVDQALASLERLSAISAVAFGLQLDTYICS